MAIMPALIINIPAILLTHLSPAKSNFFLKSITVELRSINYNPKPIKTPATRSDDENKRRSSAKSRAENAPIKANTVNRFVRVRKKIEI